MNHEWLTTKYDQKVEELTVTQKKDKMVTTANQNEDAGIVQSLNLRIR